MQLGPDDSMSFPAVVVQAKYSVAGVESFSCDIEKVQY